jgi:hypothetical protein
LCPFVNPGLRVPHKLVKQSKRPYSLTHPLTQEVEGYQKGINPGANITCSSLLPQQRQKEMDKEKKGTLLLNFVAKF